MIFVPTKAVALSQFIKIIRLLGSSIISPSRLLNRKARKAAQRKFTSCVKQAKECFVYNDHSYPNLYNHNSLQTHSANSVFIKYNFWWNSKWKLNQC